MRQPRLIMGHVTSKDNWLGPTDDSDESFDDYSTGWSKGGPSIFTGHYPGNNPVQGRIINGRPSPKGAWPWQVKINCYTK